MTIKLICTGGTSEKYISEGMRHYITRLLHYARIDVIEIEGGRGDEISIKKRETRNILKQIREQDFLILLDEKGKQISSIDFSNLIRRHQNMSTKNLVFVIGGAYGFSAEVYSRANMKIALSEMTFPHQLVRLIFLEQLYRAYTILKGEKYHH